jgi:hypothetical protein
METYLRVCTLAEGHDGEHLPYYLAPDKDEFGNKQISQPRCVHVDPVPDNGAYPLYRIVFELIDPRMPAAGWHEVVKEHHDLRSAQDQLRGLRRLEREGDDVRNPRLESAQVRWEPVNVEEE